LLTWIIFPFICVIFNFLFQFSGCWSFTSLDNVCVCVCVCVLLGIEPRILLMLSSSSTIELHLSPPWLNLFLSLYCFYESKYVLGWSGIFMFTSLFLDLDSSLSISTLWSFLVSHHQQPGMTNQNTHFNFLVTVIDSRIGPCQSYKS
jgi:hypothetical protein